MFLLVLVLYVNETDHLFFLLLVDPHPAYPTTEHATIKTTVMSAFCAADTATIITSIDSTFDTTYHTSHTTAFDTTNVNTLSSTHL